MKNSILLETHILDQVDEIIDLHREYTGGTEISRGTAVSYAIEDFHQMLKRRVNDQRSMAGPGIASVPGARTWRADQVDDPNGPSAEEWDQMYGHSDTLSDNLP